MKSTSKQMWQRSSSESRLGMPAPAPASAFTLIELLVVICVIGLLAATLVPTLAGSRIGSEAFRCQNNNRQLCSASRMYADDNNDWLLYASSDDRSASSKASTEPRTWVLGDMSFNGSQQWNWDYNYYIAKSPLWVYCGRNPTIWKCPADRSYVVFTNANLPRVRSISMNLFVGGFGGWDGNQSSYRLFLKTTDLTAPGPANTFLFIDMRPETIDVGNFFTDMTGFPNQPSQYKFADDLPGIFHNFGASVSFADGRAEIHRWADPRTAPSLAGLSGINSFASPNNVDIAWLQAHATSLK